MTTEAPNALQHCECVPESFAGIMTSACGMEVTAMLGDVEEPAEEIVLAVISLMGEVEWSVFIGLTKEVAPKLVSKFAGFDIAFDSPDLADAVGEIANIFGGEVKARLDTRGVKADISLPSVLRGENIHMMIPRDMPVVRTGFETPLGMIVIGVVAGKR